MTYVSDKGSMPRRKHFAILEFRKTGPAYLATVNEAEWKHQIHELTVANKSFMAFLAGCPVKVTVETTVKIPD